MVIFSTSRRSFCTHGKALATNARQDEARHLHPPTLRVRFHQDGVTSSSVGSRARATTIFCALLARVSGSNPAILTPASSSSHITTMALKRRKKSENLQFYQHPMRLPSDSTIASVSKELPIKSNRFILQQPCGKPQRVEIGH